MRRSIQRIILDKMKTFIQQSSVADISVYLNKGKWVVSILRKFPIREARTIELRDEEEEDAEKKAEKLFKELVAGVANSYNMKELIGICEKY